MGEMLPILILGAIIGVFSLLFILAYVLLKRSKPKDFDRHMKDGEIVRRLMVYAKPYWKRFVLVFVVMLFSIVYDLVSPLLVGHIEKTVAGEFELSYLYSVVAVYVGILLVSVVCTYLQSMILQKTGQKILSALRQDLFTHIESLSHAQLNNIPVGKLVTRVSNDTNAISYLFTNVLVTLLKNTLVIFGVLGAMLLLNYALTLMVLCFVPFVILFTIIFRKFSRKAYRQVNNATTDINTYLSENLSGMKIIQAFNREERKKAEFDQKNGHLGKCKRAQMFTFGIFRPLVYMLYVASVLFLFYIGARGYIDNLSLLGQTINAGTVVTFYMYLGKFFNPIQSLAEQFNMLQHAFAAAEKIFTVFICLL